MCCCCVLRRHYHVTLWWLSVIHNGTTSSPLCLLYITALIFNNKKCLGWPSHITLRGYTAEIAGKANFHLNTEKVWRTLMWKVPEKTGKAWARRVLWRHNKNWKHFSTGTSTELLEAQAPFLFQSLQTVTSLSRVLFLDLHLCITSLFPLTLATVVAEEPKNGHLGAICCQSRLACKGHKLG